ncbi:alcohol oxidase-like protein [Xylariaceae sp. FL0804]|nr:alcohol oxidase-like protein [Xylariaceae sp. FL0804]
MGLYKELPSDLSEVDVIVAGGGAAGCIVASRLSDADPDLSVLLIEHGANNKNNPTVITPAFLGHNTLESSRMFTFHKSRPEAALGGRQNVIPAARILGGGTSVNYLTYARAQRDDFDAWRTAGWGADDMLPHMRRLETYAGPGRPEVHGSDGPVHVGSGTYRVERTEDDFVAAAAALGWPEARDLMDMDTCNAVERSMRYISPDGRRQDVGHTYLHPRLEDGRHPNLHVLVESRVARVLFDGKRAVGVEYVPSAAADAAAAGGEEALATQRVAARKMVVLSCGSLGTPTVLERSGIGAADVLGRAGIVDVVADLPGVGEGYTDHHMMKYAYRSDLGPRETLDCLTNGTVDPRELFFRKDPILGWNGMDMVCKLRPFERDIPALGPNFREAWDRDFKPYPNKPLMMMSLINASSNDATLLSKDQFFGISTFSMYPYSRGHTHVTGPSVSDPVDFASGFFSDAGGVDVQKMVWAYKAQRELARRMRAYRGEVPESHPAFPAGSAAAPKPADGPVALDAPPLEYTAEDDKAIDAFLRRWVATTWHSLGTARMAPREQDGVVDPALGVHGLEGLKVADLSICPKNVAANTANTAMAIGEKAATLFIAELGLAN